jgi:hypothetical protein
VRGMRKARLLPQRAIWVRIGFPPRAATIGRRAEVDTSHRWRNGRRFATRAAGPHEVRTPTGSSKDTATGGLGRDLYDFNTAAESGAGTTNRDVVTDFLHLTDKLDLMGIDANGAIAGDQAFRFVGTSALTGAAQLGFFTAGGNTIVRGSTDGDAASEFEIQLNGSVALSAQDFYL